ncbi:MAG: 4Fe-4S binding protein [Cyclobacteriaceae bacterium]|nr:4Fe-4S binding protein [Cyclobacteriaceae bacterium]
MDNSLATILGKENELTGMQAQFLMEEFVCEGISYSNDATKNTDNINLFGRHVFKELSTDLSFCSGIASTGLRATSFFSLNKLDDLGNQLTEAARSHYPLVIQLNGDNISEIYQKVVNSGCFMLFANSVQEAADFTLIAHRIAELSLVPGVLFVNPTIYSSTENISLPEKQEIINYLGNPDDHIESPSSSQKIIFGKERRRIPNWFNPDLPMVSGISKNSEEMDMEVAANHRFFIDHLNGFIDQAFTEFENNIGRKYSAIVEHETKAADYILLVNGVPNENIKSAIDALRNKGQKVGSMSLVVLSPFPEQKIIANTPKKGITILEGISQNTSELGAIYVAALSSFHNSNNIPKIYSGQYTGVPNLEDFEIVYNNMKENGKKKFYLNIEFSRDQSDFPKQQILLQNIHREYPTIADATLVSGGRNLNKNLSTLQNTPNVIRRYKDKGYPYSRNSRFYDNTGVFYQTDNKEEIIADPFNSISSIPPATANFTNQINRKTIAQFDPTNCTGCGDCFVSCPHSALPPIAISIESLIKSGISMASENGVDIAKITPVIKNLSNNATKIIQDAPKGLIIAKDFLPEAFERLKGQMNLEGEKLNNLKAEFDAILSEIELFPISVNDVFFNNPELVEKGSGELFSLVVDPNACTGCGVCSDVCNEGSLTMVEPSKDILEAIYSKFNKWETLPDTDSHTISKMLANKDYDSLSAILLSRNFYLSMTGGSTSEKGSPSKVLTHLITAVTEFSVQKNSIENIKEIDELIQKLSVVIHNRLSEALPSDNFDELSEILSEKVSSKQTFDDIIHRLSEKNHAEIVDSKELKRKVDLLKELKNLKWVLTEGSTGTGRARYGLAITHSDTLNWAREYPFNSLTSPSVIHWDGSVAGKVLGLFYGQLRFVLDHIKILRRAKLEAKNKYDPSIHNNEIASISWNDLDENERLLVPPMLLIADKNEISKKGNNELSKLLSSDLPIKIIVIDDLVSAPDYYSGTYLDQILPNVALKNAYIMMGSLADKSHLYEWLQEGLNYNGSGLFYIYAPDHFKHTYKSWEWHKLPNVAMKARAYPSIKFKPSNKTRYITSLFDFEGNRQVDENWITDEIKYIENDEEKTLVYPFTYADWLFTLNSWSAHFNSVSFEENNTVNVAEYLNLDLNDRNSKIPIIIQNSDVGLSYYSVSDEVIFQTERCLATWNALKELGGILIEYPDKLKKHVEEELKSAHDNALAIAKQEYEVKLKEQESKQVEKIRLKLRDRLVALSKQNSN